MLKRKRSYFYLESILRVVQAVDSDVILHGGTGHRTKDGEFEPLDSGCAERLPHQAVRTQGLCQDVARLVIHLDIARRGEILLSYNHHIL